MEHMNTSDSNLHNDLSARSYQNFSPQTSCSLSTSGSTYSLSSSPNSVNAYANSPVDIPHINNNKRRPSMPVMQFNHYRSENSDGYLNSSMSEDQNNTSNNIEMNGARPVNRFFPDGVVDILNKWFYENQSYPYPDENMTNVLAKEAKISAKQVRKWFANKRVRSNKCYKQTFRIKKESQSKASINRRQTKSVSDSESVNFNENQHLYYENEFVSGSPETSDRKYFMWQENMGNQNSSDSSVSNSPLGFSFSPKNESQQQNCYNQMHFGDMNSSINYSPERTNHSTANSSPNNSNVLASLYNPYFLVNLLQNPSMALQAVIANRLISMNNGESNSQLDQSFDLNNSTQSNKIKRKTYLSNCFMNESSLPFDKNLQLIQEATEANQAFDPAAMTNINDLLIKHSTCSNNSLRSSFSLNEMSSSVSQQSQQVPKSAKKINFGDISSLI